MEWISLQDCLLKKMCINCNCVDLTREISSIDIELEYASGTYRAEAWACQECGQTYMTDDQMNVLLKMVRKREKENKDGMDKREGYCSSKRSSFYL